jgi:hypothetical protein
VPAVGDAGEARIDQAAQQTFGDQSGFHSERETSSVFYR